MTKRTKLALVILLGLLLLALGLYLILGQLFQPRVVTDTGQEYSTTQPAQPAKPSPSNGQPISGQPVTGTQEFAANRQPTSAEILRGLENRARNAAERVGSGSSQTGFLGYTDAMLDSTDSFKAELTKLQQDMVRLHPPTAPIYGLSTRGASSHIADGQPGDAKLVATVEAVQTIDAGNPRQPTGQGGKKIVVTFAKQSDGSYLIDGMEWSDLAL